MPTFVDQLAPLLIQPVIGADIFGVFVITAAASNIAICILVIVVCEGLSFGTFKSVFFNFQNHISVYFFAGLADVFIPENAINFNLFAEGGFGNRIIIFVVFFAEAGILADDNFFAGVDIFYDTDKGCFCEGAYRDWVIINFLLNCGCRAATVRAIQIRDVDLDGGVVFYRHTKNRKAQVIPLCSPMIAILREYGRYRGGEPTDYLFCTETGTQLTENGLRQSIARYNTRRGVQKTSIHLFRHTFARKYLIDCGGDAFTLQKLLGHSTLAMTKHYCAIYDADLTKNYDNFSPLAQMKAGGAKIKMAAKGR